MLASAGECLQSADGGPARYVRENSVRASQKGTTRPPPKPKQHNRKRESRARDRGREEKGKQKGTRRLATADLASDLASDLSSDLTQKVTAQPSRLQPESLALPYSSNASPPAYADASAEAQLAREGGCDRRSGERQVPAVMVHRAAGMQAPQRPQCKPPPPCKPCNGTHGACLCTTPQTKVPGAAALHGRTASDRDAGSAGPMHPLSALR